MCTIYLQNPPFIGPQLQIWSKIPSENWHWHQGYQQKEQVSQSHKSSESQPIKTNIILGLKSRPFISQIRPTKLLKPSGPSGPQDRLKANDFSMCSKEILEKFSVGGPLGLVGGRKYGETWNGWWFQPPKNRKILYSQIGSLSQFSGWK